MTWATNPIVGDASSCSARVWVFITLIKGHANQKTILVLFLLTYISLTNKKKFNTPSHNSTTKGRVKTMLTEANIAQMSETRINFTIQA